MEETRVLLASIPSHFPIRMQIKTQVLSLNIA